MEKTISCAVYIRVSTENQAEKEFNSCETQRKRIEHFIKSQEGFGAYDYFSDEGYSRKDLDRQYLESSSLERVSRAGLGKKIRSGLRPTGLTLVGLHNFIIV